MLFNSIAFAIFFPCVVIAHFLLPHRHRWWLLLGASCYFYMYLIPKYMLILALTIVIDYIAGRLIERSTGRARRWWLSASIVANCITLAVFKYFNFAADSIAALTNSFGASVQPWHLDWALPVGLSFHTFQAMSYTIEVYRGAQPAERHFGRFALYVLFFPQMVAGPIERPQNLIPQFRRPSRFDVVRAQQGLWMMLWGLFKKVVIADRLAVYVNEVYGDPGGFGGSSLLFATYLFSFQIYCDFSGYTDMAIGAARVLGYDLMQNFRLPYLATSIDGFWRRWHISLSTWFRDYLYHPLGGSRVGTARSMLNASAVFLISGLWHGASWMFVIWGALHAFYFVFGRLTRPFRERVRSRLGLDGPILRIFQRLLTFHLVTLAWVFFSARSLGDAQLILVGIVTRVGDRLYWGASQFGTTLGVALIGLLLAVQLLQSRGLVSLYFSSISWPSWVRWAAALVLLFGVMILGISSHEFIYFQF